MWEKGWLMNFKRIKDLREDHDLTQEEIAKILECDEDLYGSFEWGKSEISTEKLIKLARYYNVNIDYILGRTQIKKRYP